MAKTEAGRLMPVWHAASSFSRGMRLPRSTPFRSLISKSMLSMWGWAARNARASSALRDGMATPPGDFGSEVVLSFGDACRLSNAFKTKEHDREPETLPAYPGRLAGVGR